jgi:hypothetical protein
MPISMRGRSAMKMLKIYRHCGVNKNMTFGRDRDSRLHLVTRRRVTPTTAYKAKRKSFVALSWYRHNHVGLPRYQRSMPTTWAEWIHVRGVETAI